MPSSEGLFIKPGIQERGTKCGECGECGERGEWIPGKLLGDSGEYYYFNIPGMFQRIPGNAEKDSGECSKGFRGIFQKIPGNVQRDFGECSRRFRGMFKRIPGNAQEDSDYNQKCAQKFIKTSHVKEHV